MKLFVSVPDAKSHSGFIDERARAALERYFDVEYSNSSKNLEAGELLERIKGADVLMTGWGHIRLTYDLLKDTAVKYIAHTGGSVADLVDDSVFEAGIKVVSGNPIYAESVAEGTLAYMLTALRRIPDCVNTVRAGEWKIESVSTEGLLDRKVGIISLGAISKYLIDMLKPFHTEIKIYSSHKIEEEYLERVGARQVSLEEIFSTCDIVSLHSALTDKTRGMIGKEYFDLMKDGALFINTARGAVVREGEMIEALRSGRFFAMLDVFEKEPLSPDSELRRFDNVYCIPHLAGPTIDRRYRVAIALAESIMKLHAGESSEFEISKAAAGRMTRHK